MCGSNTRQETCIKLGRISFREVKGWEGIRMKTGIIWGSVDRVFDASLPIDCPCTTCIQYTCIHSTNSVFLL